MLELLSGKSHESRVKDHHNAREEGGGRLNFSLEAKQCMLFKKGLRILARLVLFHFRQSL